jgi:hypothetical protein
METIMRRFALGAFAAISLLAATGIAHAGAVSSDQRYWPSEVHESSTARPDLGFDAMASVDVAPTIGWPFVYEGGPKTGTRAYARERETFRCIARARCTRW